MSRVLILGGKGRLGAAIARRWASRHEVIAAGRAEVDIADLLSLEKRLRDADFDVLVNSAALTNVDRCESDRDEALIVNTQAVEVMARVAAEKGARLIHISTDYVFDGEKETPYLESDAAYPLSYYGQTKLDGEAAALSASPDHVVARVSWVFGPDRPSFIDILLDRARTQDHVEAVADKTSSPTHAEDAADWLEAFLTREIPGGLYHACNEGACTWQEYGQHALDTALKAGVPLRTHIVAPIPLTALKNFLAPRPRHTSMDTTRLTEATGLRPRPWREAVEDYILKKLS
jgi:dTDP-4-dehydrorhamnose reductase